MIRLHHEALGQGVEHLARKFVRGGKEFGQMSVANPVPHIIANGQFVCQIDKSRVRMKAAVQDFLIERPRRIDVRKTSDFMQMRDTQENAVGKPTFGVVDQPFGKRHSFSWIGRGVSLCQLANE
ncbi:hypothetical protein [Caballeronia sp. ATUFL_M2_KS44]|uniref:hypothetical protein n=1 Tax=Caballeronia sp. ATUFL_M2_KS44 TaxID=2921767 RepID=UPI0032EE023A